MANRKINELSPRTPSLTDLIIVGDPSTGYSFKATISVLAAFAGSNIQFSSLQGISITNPTNGQALVYDGTNWVNQSISVPVTSVFGRTGAIVATEGDYSLDLLSDVTLTSPTTNQVLQYNGTAWVNATFVAGINSLNGLTATTQTFATGTSGTDFAISSTTSTHTFNLPTASAVNRGALSSADWSTFNAKQDAITLTTTGNSGSATLVGATLNVPTYTLSGLGGVPTSRTLTINGTAFDLSADRSWTISTGPTGSGTTNYLSKWTSSSALGNSLIQDDGTSTAINSTPSASGMVSINRGALTESIILTSSDATNRIRFQNTANTQVGIIQFSSSGFGIGAGGSYLSAIEISRTTNHVGIFGSPDASFRLNIGGTFKSSGDANINGLTVGRGPGNAASNTAFGVTPFAGFNPSGTGNSVFGYQVMYQHTSGNNNAGFGYQATYSINTGSQNSGFGFQSLYSVLGGSSNSGIGYRSGYDVTSGIGNSFVGDNTGRGITTGNYNTIIGAGVTGLSSSLSNTIILADGQGNQRLVINSSGNATFSGEIIGKNSFNSGGAFAVRANNFVFGSDSVAAGSNQFRTTTGNGFSFGYIVNNSSVATYQVVSNGRMEWDSSATSTPYIFRAGGSEIARFSNGNLLIGTTTDAGFKLDVNGSARFTGNLRFDANIRDNRDNNVIQQSASGVASNRDLTIGGGGYGRMMFTSKGYSFTTGTHPSLGAYGFYFNGETSTGAGNGVSIYFKAQTPSAANSNGGDFIIELPSGTGTGRQGSVIIGGTSPNASAILELSSTTKGFLPPKGTNAQMLAIASPVSGLVFYDTTNNKLNVYDGTNWVAVH